MNSQREKGSLDLGLILGISHKVCTVEERVFAEKHFRQKIYLLSCMLVNQYKHAHKTRKILQESAEILSSRARWSVMRPVQRFWPKKCCNIIHKTFKSQQRHIHPLSQQYVHILTMDQRVNGIIALSCPAVFNGKAQLPSKVLHQQFISHVWLFWTFGNLKSFSYLDKFSKPGHLKTSEFFTQSHETL